jgi:hypothetical protein
VRRLALLLAVLLAACGEPTTGARRAPDRAPPPSAAPPLPEPGELRVERSGDRYTVLASDIPQLAALAELAALAGFRVELGAPEAASRALRLELREVSLERALARILSGMPRQVHYEFADGDLSPERPFAGRPVELTRVSVGTPAQPAEAAPGPRAEPAPADARDAAPSAEPARLRAEAEARERERAATVERDWRDPRPGVRLDAIEQMEPGSEDDRMRLAILLRDDSSAEVRSAAAERLAEGNPFAVTDSLLAALEDDDPRVAAAAVSALEDVYAEAPNPRIRERVTALRDDRDAEVREAVASFEEWLED